LTNSPLSVYRTKAGALDIRNMKQTIDGIFQPTNTIPKSCDLPVYIHISEYTIGSMFVDTVTVVWATT